LTRCTQATRGFAHDRSETFVTTFGVPASAAVPQGAEMGITSGGIPLGTTKVSRLLPSKDLILIKDLISNGDSCYYASSPCAASLILIVLMFEKSIATGLFSLAAIN
jgi:hypothetical protein